MVLFFVFNIAMEKQKPRRRAGWNVVMLEHRGIKVLWEVAIKVCS